ncbi:CRAL-TRIO domain-containing protein [Scleroderma yunnanense]
MSPQVICLSPQGTTSDFILTHLGSQADSIDSDLLLNAFKSHLAGDGLYKPAIDGAQASHDDTMLMRFLRARRYDCKKAQIKFAHTEAWRKEHDVDNPFKNFDADEMESARRFYPRWTGRRDKCGHPLYVYRLTSLHGSVRKELETLPGATLPAVVLYEAMTRFILPLCDSLPHEPSTPVSSVTTIIDLEDVSLATMWSLRSHLQQASIMATAHYPETLNVIAIVNSPSFFPIVWNWLKGWFDEATRRKIHVLGRNPGESLRQIIDPQNLPVVYEGELEWVFEDEPSLDSEMAAVVGQMPRGPSIFTKEQWTIIAAVR